MKSVILACVWFLSGVAGVRADLTVVQTVEGLGQNMESTARFKGSKTRVDTSPGTSLIMDLKTGEMINLLRGPKTYMKVSSALTQAAINSLKPGAGAAAKTTPTATGRKETISGFASEEYACTVSGVKVSLWLTRALPDYETALKDMNGALSQGPMGMLMEGYGLDLGALPGFPVRTVLELAPGQTMTRTVTSVSTQPLADAEFEIPPRYQEVTLPVLTPPAAEQPAPSKAR